MNKSYFFEWKQPKRTGIFHLRWSGKSQHEAVSAWKAFLQSLMDQAIRSLLFSYQHN